MQTKHIKVYEYKELTKDAQKVAYENWRSGVEHDFLEESMIDKLFTLLKKYKVTLPDNSMPKISYSLSYCQGDGAMFYGDYVWRKYTIKIKQSGRYSHSNSKIVDIYKDIHDNGEYNDASEKTYQDFEKVYQKICKELENYGYKCIEDAESIESFKYCCEDYKYTFTENGKMENL